MADFFPWKKYVPVAVRRRKAEKAMARLAGKDGAEPVVIEGRAIATTFWGKAWCDNLERYSDFANRLPRGRSYVRNGSVVDLKITPGTIVARVSGTRLYTTTVKVAAVPAARWRAICRDCAGAIDSLVELLQGRLSTGVMARLSQEKTGLFPSPSEITFDCSCPDWAAMCKHVAAVLYGIGARLDRRPELLFTLRGVDQQDLITRAGTGAATGVTAPAKGRVLEGVSLSEIFGLEIVEPADRPRRRPPRGGAQKQPRPT
jgi:uncharacterized Zn finger protein